MATWMRVRIAVYDGLGNVVGWVVGRLDAFETWLAVRRNAVANALWDIQDHDPEEAPF